MNAFYVLLGIGIVVLCIAVLVIACGLFHYETKISNIKIEVRPGKTTSNFNSKRK